MSRDEHNIIYTDEALIRGIQQNEENALRALYTMHFEMIARFIIANNGDEHEAKDVYQEAVIAFYEKIRSGRLELSCKVSTYLYSVCRRLWLKKLKEKKKYTGKVTDFDDYQDIGYEMPYIEGNELRFLSMESSLNKLGEPCRALLEDYYFNEMSMYDIADKFGYTNADNAKNQKYKCLQRLKKLFFSYFSK